LSAYKKIENKLKQFIQRYYVNELIKGSLLFLSIGCLYFLITLLIEYFLWLKPMYRTFLFWLFITVEISLLIKFIGIPIFKLLGLQKGITPTEASQLIGKHFSTVNDKLTNLLQLKEDRFESELLVASINQKADQLSPIPFKSAVNFKGNFKYVKYVAIPILVFLAFQLSGNKEVISSSYTRVVNHNVAYIPPAPFTIVVKNKKLQAIENDDFIVDITTKGKILPTQLKINFNNESYFLNKTDFNTYQYHFKQIQNGIDFNISGNDVISKNYKIAVIQVPNIIHFSMYLNYPTYTGKKDEWIKNTGSHTVPEGTQITWKIKTKTTDKIAFSTLKKQAIFKKEGNLFKYNTRVFKNLNYQIATSNTAIKNYEKLNYNIQTIRDAYPNIQMQSKRDSLDNQIVYFLGKISDDYGLKKLQLVYNQIDSGKKEIINIPIKNGNYQQFTYAFPGKLPLIKGKGYEYYFEVYDNDAVHQYKKSKSEVFTYHKLTDAELEAQKLKEQEKNIDNLSKSLNKIKHQEKELKEINQLQKEKKELSWMDKLKVKNIFKKEDKQNQMMQKINKDLQRNLDEFQKDKQDDTFKEDLQKRLKEQEKDLEKNEKLLEELKKLKDKISDEELFDKIEKLTKEQKNKEKSLEQVLELTKRYYIKKKFEKVVNDLEALAKKQEELSKKEGDENTKEKQDALNKEFKKIQEELENIKKENQELQKPMGLDEKKENQEEIKKDQQEASDNLEKQDKKEAKKKQKDAAKKLQQMSMSMRKQQQSSSEEQMDEDIKMLRQILDNLLKYSFNQESLMDQIKNLDSNFSMPEKLKKQHVLKDNFKHIDDSLFALSLRQPKLSEMINKEVTDVHFNINKALARFADVKTYLGVTNQQYALTAANNLANFLSTVLDAMENAAKSTGMGSCDKPGGKGESFSLPDIIQKQEELLGKMKAGKKKGESGKPKDGEGKKPGEKGKPGESGKSGKGSDGENGEGKDGKQKGKEGKGNEPVENNDENTAQELYEIYKQQQQLKQQLQDYLKKNGGTNANTNLLLKQMEGIENQLLESGFHDNVAKQMENIKHEMLKLMKAAYKQGEDNKREATTNTNNFTNKVNTITPKIEQYFNEVEILNRQALPLQPIYKKKVQQYFK